MRTGLSDLEDEEDRDGAHRLHTLLSLSSCRHRVWRTDEMGEGNVGASLSSVEGQEGRDDGARAGCRRRRRRRGDASSPPRVEGQTR